MTEVDGGKGHDARPHHLLDSSQTWARFGWLYNVRELFLTLAFNRVGEALSRPNAL